MELGNTWVWSAVADALPPIEEQAKEENDPPSSPTVSLNNWY